MHVCVKIESMRTSTSTDTPIAAVVAYDRLTLRVPELRRQ